MNQTESNEKILKIISKEDDLLYEEIELFKKLIFQCDLKQQNNMGHTALMYALYYNKEQNLNLREEQWDYLIKNSDLSQQDKASWNPIMYALYYNKEQELNLNEEQWDYLIKNSDLNQKDSYGWTTLMYALYYNKKENLKLAIKQLQTIYDILDKEQQQITFQKFAQEYVKNKNQYQEEINILLYDLKFQPNQETINWLKENKHQDILKIIKKRDVFFQLKTDIKPISNHQKITTIKL